MPSLSSDEIHLVRGALVRNAADVALAILGEPNWKLSRARELRFGNRGSVAIAVKGPKAGHWYDHENREGGDLFRLIQRAHRCSFGEAILYAMRLLDGVPPPARHSTRATVKSNFETTAAYALKLFSEAVRILNTPAAGYLNWRGVLDQALEAGDGVIRFIPTPHSAKQSVVRACSPSCGTLLLTNQKRFSERDSIAI